MSIQRGHWLPNPSLRSLLPALLVATLCAAPAYAQQADRPAVDGGQLTLDAAVETALTRNPGLAALDAHRQSLEAVPAQVAALPDPVLSINALNLPVDTFDLDQEPMTQVQIALGQSIPFPGKRKLSRNAAEHDARSARARVEEQRDVLTGAVRAAWWQLFALDRAIEIVGENQALMRDFVEIAQTKYVVGKGLQQDVLLAQLELSSLLEREARLKGRQRSARAELNSLMNRSPDYAVLLARTPPNVTLPELPSESVLLVSAAESRDLLAVHRHLLEAADSRLALAKRDVYPDLRLGAGYGIRQGIDPLRGGERADFFSIMFSVNVPLYFGSKQSKAIDQRSSERTQRNYALSDALRSVEAEISRNLASYDAAREQVQLLQTAIIPQAQHTVASMLAGYQVNAVDFLNVANGQLTLYNAQISYWEALSRAKMSLAGLAAAVGMEALYE